MISTALGTYDAELQMFVEPPHELDQDVLEMWRKRAARIEPDSDETVQEAN